MYGYAITKNPDLTFSYIDFLSSFWLLWFLKFQKSLTYEIEHLNFFCSQTQKVINMPFKEDFNYVTTNMPILCTV